MPEALVGQALKLPTGTVTFLLSDIQASTAAWDSQPSLMTKAVARHDEIFRRNVGAHEGVIVESGREGDSMLCAFNRASDAVSCALEVQRAMAAEPWPPGAEIRVRIALHIGEAQLRDGHYHGQVVYRCARLMATAHGGQTLVSQAVRDMVIDQLPAGAALVDLGDHALKDLARSERIFQLNGSGLESAFPPIRSQERNLSNLPLQLTSFMGRSKELADLRRSLAARRLVTITGAAGLGKTRLALEVASQLVGAYSGGVWLAEMGPITDGSLVLQAVASSFGLREMGGQALVQTLQSHLRSRQCLVLLDNCEHVVRATSSLAEALLGSCEGLTILATSQERLGVTGEVIHRLAPMEAVRAGEPDGAGEVTEAVSLFIDRARLSEPALRLERDDAAIISEICQRLDGIPLAIELAAARVNVMSLEELLDRLDDRYRLLRADNRNVVPRHQTLRAAVDWGYELLGEDERALFRRLSVFTGGFRLDATEAICAGGAIDRADVVGLLTRLIDKSLIVPDVRGGRAGRMRLLETLRQYSRDRLRESEEEGEFTKRHAAHFREVAESARRNQRSARSLDWLLQLEDEHENLRAALGTLLEAEVDGALSLATALLWFWDVHGYLTEGREWLSKALAAAPERSASRARAADAAGWLCLRLGDFDASAAHFEESISIARETGEPIILTRALRNLGLSHLLEGRTGDATPFVDESLEVARAQGDAAAVAGSLLVMALVSYFRGDLAAAAKHGEQSIELHRELGDEKVVAFLLACLASLSIDRGDLPGAASRLAESLTLSRRLGDRVDIAFVLETSASLASAESKARRALRLAGAADRLRQRVGAQVVPIWRIKLEASLARARASLASQEAVLAWDEGGQMTLEEAIRYAESAVPEPESTSSQPESAAQSDRFGLTRRELEIVVLVAQGMTNRDVAARLFIAPRTVDSHVEHIRNKLGYRSRTQVTAWAAARGLVQ